jgi:hypothetical protein
MKKTVGAAIAAALVGMGAAGTARAADSVLVFNPLQPLAILNQTLPTTPAVAATPAVDKPVTVSKPEDPGDKDKEKRSKHKPPKDDDHDHDHDHDKDH